MNIGSVNRYIYRARAQDVVNAFPLAFIAICTLDAIHARGILRKISHTVLLTDALHDFAIGILIEIASYQYAGIGRNSIDGIYSSTQPAGNCLTERAAVMLTAIATGSVDDKDVKRIATNQLTSDIKDVSRRSHSFDWLHTDTVVTDRHKRVMTVHQGDINTTTIG